MIQSMYNTKAWFLQIMQAKEQECLFHHENGPDKSMSIYFFITCNFLFGRHSQRLCPSLVCTGTVPSKAGTIMSRYTSCLVTTHHKQTLFTSQMMLKHISETRRTGEEETW